MASLSKKTLRGLDCSVLLDPSPTHSIFPLHFISEDAPLSLREKTLRGLKSLFIAHRQGVEEIKKLAAQNAKKGEEEEMNMSETEIAIKKQEILVLYLKVSCVGRKKKVKLYGIDIAPATSLSATSLSAS